GNADYDLEVGVLSRLSHPNIINLIGCCAYKDTEHIIVYEFMPLRTLYDQLHGN
ncbi:serine/threonine-protein kinase pbs1, partial [Phtheirospermum japonicum]